METTVDGTVASGVCLCVHMRQYVTMETSHQKIILIINRRLGEDVITEACLFVSPACSVSLLLVSSLCCILLITCRTSVLPGSKALPSILNVVSELYSAASDAHVCCVHSFIV